MSCAVELRKICIAAPALRAELGVNSMLCPLLLTAMAPEINTPFWETYSAPVSELAFMGALVNRVITVLAATFVAPFPGRMLITVGALFETAGVVVNWLVVLVSAFPDISVIRLVAVTVIEAPAGKVELL